MITIYSKPGCPSCRATKRAFDKAGLRYIVYDVSTCADAMTYARSTGYTRLPIVEAQGRSWSGFRPDLIKQLAEVTK